MTALLILGLIAIVVGFYIFASNKNNPDNRTRLAGRTAGIIGIVLVVIGIITGSFTSIPAGHRGVVVRFSAVTGTILEEGLQTKLPFVDSVVRMSVQTQKYEADATSASKDLQDVVSTIVLNWRLDPSMVDEVYRTLGMDYIEKLAAPAIQETVKQVTARYIAEDLILKRDEVKAAIKENLEYRLAERGIITETVSITNFQFSETFTAAIEAKVAAEQSVLEAKNKLERIKVEAQQAEAAAEGEANARIAKANGEAEYIRIVTEAQVSANEAISDSLTPEVLQYILLDRLGEDIKLIVIPSGQGLDIVMPELDPEEIE